jgi:hypothetical protein
MQWLLKIGIEAVGYSLKKKNMKGVGDVFIYPIGLVQG